MEGEVGGEHTHTALAFKLGMQMVVRHGTGLEASEQASFLFFYKTRHDRGHVIPRSGERDLVIACLWTACSLSRHPSIADSLGRTVTPSTNRSIDRSAPPSFANHVNFLVSLSLLSPSARVVRAILPFVSQPRGNEGPTVNNRDHRRIRPFYLASRWGREHCAPPVIADRNSSWVGSSSVPRSMINMNPPHRSSELLPRSNENFAQT